MSRLAILDMVYLLSARSNFGQSAESKKVRYAEFWEWIKRTRVVTGAGYLLKKAWTSALAYRYPPWVKISVNGVAKSKPLSIKMWGSR